MKQRVIRPKAPPGVASRSGHEVLDTAIADRLLSNRLITIRAERLETNDDRTVDVVFSAGAEYRQFWGRELLSLEGCNLERLNSRLSPVLLNHDKGSVIGVVESARIEGTEGIATLRFSKSRLGDEVYQDILDGIRGQISCGYQINKYEIDETNERDPLFTVTDWTPFEISVVAYAADPNAVVKRDDFMKPLEVDGTRSVPTTEEPTTEDDGTRSVPTTEEPTTEEEDTMDPKEAIRLAQAAGVPELGMRAIQEDWTLAQLEEQIRAAAQPTPTPTPIPTPTPTPTPAPVARREDEPTPADPEPAPEAAQEEAAEQEDEPEPEPSAEDSERVSRIYDLGQEYNEREMAIDAISENLSIEEFQKRLLEKNRENKRAAASQDIPERITLDPKDQRNFRVANLLYFLANNKAGTRGGQEFEICQEEVNLRQKQGLLTQGTPIPPAIFDERQIGAAVRALNVGTNTAGGYTVDDELLTDSFIDLLMEYTAATGLVTRLDDLMGNLTFPRQDARATAQWVGETTAAAEQNPTFDVVQMSPKHLRAWTRVSTQLLRQSSISVEQFLRRDLARAVAKAMDSAILTGTGSSNQPKGIAALGSDRLTVDYPSDGDLDYDSVLACEEKLADKNALMGRLAWVISPKMRKAGRKTAELGTGTSRPIFRDGKMIDYPAHVTTQVDNTDASGKGYLANWEEMILGCWGSIDVIVNPYSEDKEGFVRISIGQMCDLAARHVESFVELKKGA